ncbi:putative phosphoribosyl transferase [bioreactor metagenome]|uniref:Putative phosphoribosyl transferase n=1 Tax=bioreactor metagenome TaxID=1076179 RepID=A0A644TQV3_9ZZZZ|nr:phosphoribosyltransferase family protein [Negativicutes bacterium]
MFINRTQAGEQLAERLTTLNLANPCLLAVPRGGIVVAAPIAKKLNLKVGVLITRKIGHPLNPEVAIGAVMPDGSAVWNETTTMQLGLDKAQLEALIRNEYMEIKRRLTAYTGIEHLPDIRNKTVILIDDGIATGYTIFAALKWLKNSNSSKIVIAVPVAPPDVTANLASQVDDVTCLVQPHDFMSVGQY